MHSTAHEGVTHINEPQLQRQQDYRLAFTERARHDIRSKSSSASHDFLLSKSPTHCCWQPAHHSVGVYVVLKHAEWITLRPTRIVTWQTYNAGLTTRITRSQQAVIQSTASQMAIYTHTHTHNIYMFTNSAKMCVILPSCFDSYLPNRIMMKGDVAIPVLHLCGQLICLLKHCLKAT